MFAIVALILFVGCGPHDAESASELADCYKADFGTFPPAGIIVENARNIVIGDWGSQWLKIHADATLIDSVILKDFARQNSVPSDFTSKQRYTPPWWVLPPSEQLEYYTSGRRLTNGTWYSTSASAALHRAKGTIFYRCDRSN
jgi:hypothetical protein